MKSSGLCSTYAGNADLLGINTRCDCPLEKDSLGKDFVQAKHSKRLEVENTSWIIHPFPFSWVSSRDRVSECPPHPCLVTSCSHFQTTFLHPTDTSCLLAPASQLAWHHPMATGMLEL